MVFWLRKYSKVSEFWLWGSLCIAVSQLLSLTRFSIFKSILICNKKFYSGLSFTLQQRLVPFMLIIQMQDLFKFQWINNFFIEKRTNYSIFFVLLILKFMKEYHLNNWLIKTNFINYSFLTHWLQFCFSWNDFYWVSY